MQKVTVEITVEDEKGTSTYRAEGTGRDCDDASSLLHAAVSAAAMRDSQPPYMPPPEMFATFCLRRHGYRNLANVLEHLLWERACVNIYPDVLVRQGEGESVAKHLCDEIDGERVHLEAEDGVIRLKRDSSLIGTIREQASNPRCS